MSDKTYIVKVEIEIDAKDITDLVYGLKTMLNDCEEIKEWDAVKIEVRDETNR